MTKKTDGKKMDARTIVAAEKWEPYKTSLVRPRRRKVLQ